MALPVQMAMKSSNGVNAAPTVLPLQQQMQILPHAQAQAIAQVQQNQIQHADRSSVLSDTTSATWLAIGSLAESLGDLERASLLYDAALRHSPNNSDALTRLANIYRSRDHFLKAAELYEQALNFNPENGDTWGLLGHCYLMMDDLQRAYAAYQRALYYLDNPNVPKLWHGIGILYDRYGSLEYAEEAFVRVLDLDPNFDKSNEIYFRLGIIYKHQGKLPSALECFQYILSNPPHPLTQPDVWFQIGSVLEQQKNWNGAKEAYEKVLEVNPNHAKVLQQLGCLYSQAEPAAATQTQPGQQPFQQDLNIALKYLSQSIEIDSTDAHSWYYLGRVHMIRGDFNAAYEAFQQAVNRDSRNPTFWCSIGVLYYQISQYRDALDAYTRAIRLNPYISEVWYDLGTLYETCNNQISDALDAYRQAERLDPGNPHIKARLEQLIKYQQDGNTHPPQPPPVSQQPRLPQGMVLESTQPQQPQQPPGPQQLHQGPPPPQLQQGQPIAYHQPLQPPPNPAQIAQPPAQQQYHTTPHPPVAQVIHPPNSHSPDKLLQPPQPAIPSISPARVPTPEAPKQDSTASAEPNGVSNGAVKHDLEEKVDDHVAKKPNSGDAPVLAPKAEEMEGIKPHHSEPSPAAPAPPSNVPAETPAVALAPVVPAATPQTTNVASSEAATATPQPSPAPPIQDLPREKEVTPAAPNPTVLAAPAHSATPPVPQFSSNVVASNPAPAAKNDDDDDEEEEEKSEPVEPPMRKVEEDENYDDE